MSTQDLTDQQPIDPTPHDEGNEPAIADPVPVPVPMPAAPPPTAEPPAPTPVAPAPAPEAPARPVSRHMMIEKTMEQLAILISQANQEKQQILRAMNYLLVLKGGRVLIPTDVVKADVPVLINMVPTEQGLVLEIARP